MADLVHPHPRRDWHPTPAVVAPTQAEVRGCQHACAARCGNWVHVLRLSPGRPGHLCWEACGRRPGVMPWCRGSLLPPWQPWPCGPSAWPHRHRQHQQHQWLQTRLAAASRWALLLPSVPIQCESACPVGSQLPQQQQIARLLAGQGWTAQTPHQAQLPPQRHLLGCRLPPQQTSSSASCAAPSSSPSSAPAAPVCTKTGAASSPAAGDAA